MRLSWNENLRTGIREIDLQHQELIEIINDLDTIQGDQNARGTLDIVVSRLASYIMFHFETEEAMFNNKAESLSHCKQHAQAHHMFVERFTNFQKLPLAERLHELGAMLAFLKQWLIEHILKTDKELANLVRGKRRKYGQ